MKADENPLLCDNITCHKTRCAKADETPLCCADIAFDNCLELLQLVVAFSSCDGYLVADDIDDANQSSERLLGWALKPQLGSETSEHFSFSSCVQLLA